MLDITRLSKVLIFKVFKLNYNKIIGNNGDSNNSLLNWKIILALFKL